MRLKYQICTLFVAAALAACGKPAEEAAPDMATPPPASAAPDTATSAPAMADKSLRERLASPERPAADRERDEGRKPADVIEFLGIEPGMTVVDIIAAGGYYTEVLSIAVGPDGKVVAQNPDAVLKFRDGANETALSERLAGNRLPNVSRLNRDFQEITAEDGSFDAAITALNLHDIYNGSGPEAAVSVLKKVYSMLKPGGVFGIIDHVGIADADNTALHRIEKSRAIETAKAAGFILEDESDLLSNADDDHSEGPFAESLRGHTDRFLLKMRKPAQ